MANTGNNDVLNNTYNSDYYIAPKRYYDKHDGCLLTASQALRNCRYRLVPFGNEWLVTEVMMCDRPKFNSGDYGLIGELHKSRLLDADEEPLSPEEQKEYIDRSRRRARRAVRDLMDANSFDWFITFTLDEKKVGDRSDYKRFIELVRQYMDNHVRRHGWRYVAVVEYHKNKKGLHLHAAVSADSIKLVHSGTYVRPCGGRPVMMATALRQGYRKEELRDVYNVVDWYHGFSTAIHTYGRRLDLARYIAKYITKSDDKIGGRWYYSGGKLERPIYLTDNRSFDSFVGDVEFDHEFGSFKIKYYDDGVRIDWLENQLC